MKRPRQITINLTEQTIQLLEERARAERRSRSNMAALLIERQLNANQKGKEGEDEGADKKKV